VIAYFDTSAVVPLVVAEAGSARAATLWDGADRAVSVRLVYPEGRAALAQAQRLGRLTVRQLRAAVREFEARYLELDVVELDDVLARRAGHLAELYGLRGYDGVHLAAADRVCDPDLVVVAGDRALLTAAAAKGLATSSLS
jgi:predicted nucleic acid-binding protein